MCFVQSASHVVYAAMVVQEGLFISRHSDRSERLHRMEPLRKVVRALELRVGACANSQSQASSGRIVPEKR